MLSLFLVNIGFDPYSTTKSQVIDWIEEDPVGSTCGVDVVSLEISYWELPKPGFCSYVGISTCAVLYHITQPNLGIILGIPWLFIQYKILFTSRHRLQYST